MRQGNTFLWKKTVTSRFTSLSKLLWDATYPSCEGVARKVVAVLNNSHNYLKLVMQESLDKAEFKLPLIAPRDALAFHLQRQPYSASKYTLLFLNNSVKVENTTLQKQKIGSFESRVDLTLKKVITKKIIQNIYSLLSLQLKKLHP